MTEVRIFNDDFDLEGVVDWIGNNCIGRVDLDVIDHGNDFSHSDTEYRFRFLHAEDALLFQLTWGGQR